MCFWLYHCWKVSGILSSQWSKALCQSISEEYVGWIHHFTSNIFIWSILLFLAISPIHVSIQYCVVGVVRQVIRYVTCTWASSRSCWGVDAGRSVTRADRTDGMRKCLCAENILNRHLLLNLPLYCIDDFVENAGLLSLKAELNKFTNFHLNQTIGLCAPTEKKSQISKISVQIWV